MGDLNHGRGSHAGWSSEAPSTPRVAPPWAWPPAAGGGRVLSLAVAPAALCFVG